MTTTHRGRVRVEDGQKRIRVHLGGRVVADSTSVKLVWEKPYYPVYYFPIHDVHPEALVPTGETYRSPSRGTAEVHTVAGDDAQAAGAARVWTEVKIEDIDGHVSFRWQAMDAWFEEDEEVFVHARNPYTRVDILESSRHVEVVIDGVKVADTDRPLLLFETGLPVRYYIPREDVRLDRLTESGTTSACPYKGNAGYFHVEGATGTVEDIVWTYESPLPESDKIAGYVSLYNERVDIYVDGELQERPRTMFS
jgi:uncharacterized protein (DUF427 family)